MKQRIIPADDLGWVTIEPSGAWGSSGPLQPGDAYRYFLWRCWDPELKPLLAVLLNPSTADGKVPDPTVKKMIRFAKKWRCGRLWVVNLYAYRASKPTMLFAPGDPVGPHNGSWLAVALNQVNAMGGLTVCGWGSTKAPNKNTQVERVRALAEMVGEPLHALRLSKDGHPWHPLYLPEDGSAKPRLWRP